MSALNGRERLVAVRWRRKGLVVPIATDVLGRWEARELEMTHEQNLKIAHKYISALSAGAEPDDLEVYFDADFIQEEFPNRLLPNGATRDLQSMKQARARGKALLSAEHFEIVRALASGNRVAMELVWTGTVGVGTGPFVDGQELRARFAIFLEFRDGRIVRQHNYDCFDPW